MTEPADLRAELLAGIGRREEIARAAGGFEWEWYYADEGPHCDEPAQWDEEMTARPDGQSHRISLRGPDGSRRPPSTWDPELPEFSIGHAEEVLTPAAMLILMSSPATVLRQLAGVRAVVEIHRPTYKAGSGVEWCVGCPGVDIEDMTTMEDCPNVRALYDAFCRPSPDGEVGTAEHDSNLSDVVPESVEAGTVGADGSPMDGPAGDAVGRDDSGAGHDGEATP